MSLSDDIGLPGDAAASTARRAGRRPRPGEGLLLLVWSLVVVAAVVVLLHRQETAELHDPVKQGERGEIAALGPLSLLTADRLSAALGVLGDRYPGGTTSSVRIAPLTVDATMLHGDDAVARVRVDAGLHAHVWSTGASTEKGIPLARIDPAGPQRLVRAVNARTGTRPADVDYVVVTVSPALPHGARLSLFLARGVPPDRRMYTSDLSGHHVKGT